MLNLLMSVMAYLVHGSTGMTARLQQWMASLCIPYKGIQERRWVTKVHIGEDTSHELGVGSILFVAGIPLRITRLPYVIIP